MLTHPATLIPSEGSPQMDRQMLNCVDEGITHRFSTVITSKANKHHEACRAFDKQVNRSSELKIGTSMPPTVIDTSPHRDSNPDCADFKSAASASWAMGGCINVPTFRVRTGHRAPHARKSKPRRWAERRGLRIEGALPCRTGLVRQGAYALRRARKPVS